MIMLEIPSLDRLQSMKHAAQRILDTQNRNFVVTDQGRPIGTIVRDRIFSVMKECGGETLVEPVDDPHCAYVSEDMPPGRSVDPDAT